MEFTRLGNTGMTVSRICLGCMSYGETKSPEWARQREWAVGADEAREHFAIALDAGINFFDTADTYSAGVSEEITGRWLNEMASRDDIVVATKVYGGVAVLEGVIHREGARMAAVRLDAEPLQPGLP